MAPRAQKAVSYTAHHREFNAALHAKITAHSKYPFSNILVFEEAARALRLLAELSQVNKSRRFRSMSSRRGHQFAREGAVLAPGPDGVGHSVQS
jgi:hypothetical protein